MRPRVFVTHQLPDKAIERLGAVCDYSVGTSGSTLDRQHLLAGVREADGLICQLTDLIDREVLNAGSKLRVIANLAAGYNNIDITAAEKSGIFITNTPGVLTDATADLTWALILAVTRRIPEADTFVRKGHFTGWNIGLLLGTSLNGKTLGIIGYGRIGRAVARRAMGFGMKVIYCGRDDIAYRDDPQYNAHMIARQSMTNPLSQSARIDGLTARRMTFNQLIENSDIVSLHVPLAATTRHLINAATFARMKPTAFLINTARGEIVDETALVEALKHRRIAGAGLDVFENEPQISEALLQMDNTVLLPHLGSATREARTAMAMLAVENVIDALSGKEPRNVVRH